MRGNNKPGKSGYFGVCWNERARKWAVQIRTENKTKYLGLFSDIKEAALTFDREARKLHGKEANLNFPGGEFESSIRKISQKKPNRSATKTSRKVQRINRVFKNKNHTKTLP